MHRHPRFLALLEANETTLNCSSRTSSRETKPTDSEKSLLWAGYVFYHKALCCPSLYEPLFYKSYINRLLQRYRMFALCFDVNSAVNCFSFVFRVPHVRFLKNYRVKKTNTFDWWLFLGYLTRLCSCGRNAVRLPHGGAAGKTKKVSFWRELEAESW